MSLPAGSPQLDRTRRLPGPAPGRVQAFATDLRRAQIIGEGPGFSRASDQTTPYRLFLPLRHQPRVVLRSVHIQRDERIIHRNVSDMPSIPVFDITSVAGNRLA